ncbi:MAG: hypothetical protein ACU0CB_04175, partial [Roseovarius sp.]
TPPSARRRIAMICASVYLLVFIRNLLVHLAEKILLLQPLKCGGDYPVTGHSGVEMLKKYGGPIRQRELAKRAQEARNQMERSKTET